MHSDGEGYWHLILITAVAAVIAVQVGKVEGAVVPLFADGVTLFIIFGVSLPTAIVLGILVGEGLFRFAERVKDHV